MSAQTSTTEQSRAVAQAFYDAIIAGDAEGFMAVTSPDVINQQPAFLPYGGTRHGRDAFVGLFPSFAGHYDLTKIRCERLVAEGDRVFSVVRVPFLQNGQDVVLAEELVVRDGLIVEMRIFAHEAQTLVTRADR